MSLKSASYDVCSRQRGPAGQVGVAFMVLFLVVLGCAAFAIEFARFAAVQTQTQQQIELAQDAVQAVSDQIQYRSVGDLSDASLGELGRTDANDAVLTAFAAVESSLLANGFEGSATVQCVEVGEDVLGTDSDSVRVMGVRIILSTDFSWWLGSLFTDSDIEWAEDGTFTLVFSGLSASSEDDGQTTVYRPDGSEDGYGASITWTFSDGSAAKVSETEYSSDSVLDSSSFESLKAAINSTLSSL